MRSKIVSPRSTHLGPPNSIINCKLSCWLASAAAWRSRPINGNPIYTPRCRCSYYRQRRRHRRCLSDSLPQPCCFSTLHSLIVVKRSDHIINIQRQAAGPGAVSAVAIGDGGGAAGERHLSPVSPRSSWYLRLRHTV